MKPPVVAPIDVHLESDWWRSTLESDIRTGLTANPKSIPAKWFYDEVGSQLFDQITTLDEYYPFRAEREILRTHADAIVAAAGADVLVELGSGTSEKSRVLLSAMQSAGQLNRYIPFDVSEEMLRLAAGEIATEFPEAEIHGVVGDFERHIPLVPIDGTGMIAFLGSTIGNFEPANRAKFLASVASALEPGGTFLLGTDLIKDPQRLWAAYNDNQGVTAAFNLNLLTMLNRELNAEFDIGQFEHAADWDAQNEWVDIRVRSLSNQRVTIADLDMVVELAAGEEVRTEVSAKFRIEGIAQELAAVGLTVENTWTDAAEDFALTWARR